MKKISLILLILGLFTLPLLAQSQEIKEEAQPDIQKTEEITNNTEESSQNQDKEESEDPTRPLLVFPKLNLIFDEGITYCQLTRIERQEDRSNFVRENFMAGAYFNLQTVDLSFFDFTFGVSAYYPFYQAFNGMKQKPKNMFNYAIDTYTGIVITEEFFKMVKIDLSLGMHYMYQLTDEYHMNYLGLGTQAAFILPITKNWSIVERNIITFDNANLGSNKNIQPFDGSFQYHFNLGVSYSKKVLNKYYYIDTSKAEARKAQRKADKKALKEAQKKIQGE
ncbi:MAG: hypothetical protein K5866_02785 [Treponema sp.]|nr:hypothetical protein [Treponema sp.]